METANMSKPQAGPAKGKSNQKRKPNAERAKAQDAYQSPKAKGLITIDSDFLGFSQEFRNNTMVDFDPTLNNRLADNYVTKALEVAAIEGLQEPMRTDLLIETYSLISLTIARKLFISAPQQEETELDGLRVMRGEFFTCPTLYTIVANLGKLDFDSYVVRLRYGAQDIFRNVFSTLKVASRHSLMIGYPSIEVSADNDAGMVELPWADVTPENLVFNCNASANWITDNARIWLKSTLANDITLHLPNGNDVIVSYPYLDIEGARDVLIRNIATWLAKLREDLPDVFTVARAACMLVWDKSWFLRLNENFSVLTGVQVPALFDFTPIEMMATFGIQYVYLNTGAVALGQEGGPIPFLERLYELILSKKSRFDMFLNTVKMPDDKFGSKAQLFAIPTSQHMRPSVMPGLNLPVVRLRPEAAATVLFKIDDPSLATVGIFSGFTTATEIKPTFKARVVNDVNSTRTKVLNGDRLRYNRF